MAGLLVTIRTLCSHLVFMYMEALYRLVVPRPRKDVRGKVVLVTGAGSGIGRQLAVRFARLGVRLVLWDIDKAGNEETAKLIQERGGEVHAYQCDVSDNEEVTRTAKLSRRDVGANVDILINNAGVMPCKELLDLSEEEIRRTIGVNTLAHFWTTRAFLPNMVSQRYGHIVTMASMAGTTGASMLTDYSASKFGAIGFTEALHAELCRSGDSNVVKTTIVIPYIVNSNLLDKIRHRIQIRSPFIRTLETPEVAEVIVTAVLRDTFRVYIPGWAGVTNLAKMLMPQKVTDYLAQLSDTGFYPTPTCP